MFLLVPAYPGCPGSKAVKRSLLLLLCLRYFNNVDEPLHVCVVHRFIVYSDIGGDHQMTSLVEQFTRQLMQSPPDLLVIGGLRQLISAQAAPGTTDH